MNKEKLREYIDNLNLNYYTESELEKIYKAVATTVSEIEELIGMEEA